MFESILTTLIRQAALLTGPQQEEFTTKIAEALSTLINSTETEIDNELVRSVALPIGGTLIEKLEGMVYVTTDHVTRVRSQIRLPTGPAHLSHRGGSCGSFISQPHCELYRGDLIPQHLPPVG